MWKSAFVTCAVACSFVSVVRADPEPAARHGGWVIVNRVDPSDTSVNLILRNVAVPAATVSRQLSEQPLRPFMAEVQVGNITTYLDPEADYAHRGPGTLDENHWILRAQREFCARHADTSAYLITGRPTEATGPGYEPSMILLKPQGAPRPHDSFTPTPIPNAPVEKHGDNKVVMAK